MYDFFFLNYIWLRLFQLPSCYTQTYLHHKRIWYRYAEENHCTAFTFFMLGFFSWRISQHFFFPWSGQNCVSQSQTCLSWYPTYLPTGKHHLLGIFEWCEHHLPLVVPLHQHLCIKARSQQPLHLLSPLFLSLLHPLLGSVLYENHKKILRHLGTSIFCLGIGRVWTVNSTELLLTRRRTRVWGSHWMHLYL